MAGAVREPLPVVVLISGRGSNLEAIVGAARNRELPIDIRAVISNCPQAAGLEIARRAGIETRVIDHTRYADRPAFDAALQDAVDGFAPRLVLLAGFMRILTPEFVAHYRGRLINIHPSLLPEFPGLDTHRRVLDAGRGFTGATVHFVTAETDGGPPLLQVRVPVHPGDTADSLAARVLAQEHRLYPAAIRLLAEGRAVLGEDDAAWLDGERIEDVPQLDTGRDSRP